MTTSECEWLDDYFDGGLPSDRQILFEQHLHQCDACHQASADWNRTRFVLSRATEELNVPSRALLSRIERSTLSTLATDRARPNRNPGRHVWAILAPICVLIGVMFVFGSNPFRATQDEYFDFAQHIRSDPAAGVVSPQLHFTDEVIAVPIDLGDPNVVAVWLFPTASTRNETN